MWESGRGLALESMSKLIQLTRPSRPRRNPLCNQPSRHKYLTPSLNMFKPPSNSEEEHDRMHALLKALLCGPKEIVDETERVVQEDLAISSRKRDQLDIDKYRKAQDLAAIVEAQRWKRLERSGRQYSSSLAENLTERRKRARERKDRKLAEENEKLLKRFVFFW